VPVSDLHELNDSARDEVEAYLGAIEAGLCGVDPEVASDALESIRAHLLEHLEPESTASDVTVMTEELGGADEYASVLCDVVAEPHAESSPVSGSILGVPFELRVPTAERIASRWWNPQDPRLFVPRVFGIGWDLNFGALAVRLHWIEPDSEDEPFAEVSDRAFLAALALPVGLTAAMLGSYLALRAELPPRVPVHWNFAGVPDRFGATTTAFIALFALALAPTVWAVWSVAIHRRALNRAAVVGLATMMSVLSAGIWAITLVTGLGGATPGWLFLALVLAAVAAPLGVMTALARSGRAAEIRRDLSRD